MIIVSSLFLGVEAELAQREENYVGLFKFMRLLDLFTLAAFLVEMLLKWVDNFTGYWKDNWNLFDFAVTLLSLVPELIGFFSSGSGVVSIALIGSELRTLRIMRTLKLVVRFGSLKIIILTIIQALGSMASIGLLILIFAYAYAIVGVNLYYPFTNAKDTGLVYTDIFANIGRGLQTLCQFLTLDDWIVNYSWYGFAHRI